MIPQISLDPCLINPDDIWPTAKSVHCICWVLVNKLVLVGQGHLVVGGQFGVAIPDPFKEEGVAA